MKNKTIALLTFGIMAFSTSSFAQGKGTNYEINFNCWLKIDGGATTVFIPHISHYIKKNGTLIIYYGSTSSTLKGRDPEVMRAAIVSSQIQCNK